MNIRLVGAEFFLADRQTDVTKLFTILWTQLKIQNGVTGRIVEEVLRQMCETQQGES